ncbi:MAG: diguanylate cyclase [Deltaproteobacteria bacterium]|nr:diguanylate cyclase [Deltaproteobacteria bacterium]
MQSVVELDSTTPHPVRVTPVPVAAIGASAGGLESLIAFFRNMSPTSGAAFIVVQHLSPQHKSLMDSILAKHTTMAVHQVRETVVVEPNCVYLIPPEHNIIYVSGRIELKPRAERPAPNRPVDLCFESLAANLGHRCIGVLLSGTGSDGTRGASAIKQSGGLVIAEDPRTAKFADMPRNAVQTGWIDLVAESSELARWVSEFLEISAIGEGLEHDAAPDHDLMQRPTRRLIELLRERKDVDFSAYNASMFIHRLRRRMLLSNRSSLERYIELVEQDFGELDALYNELLIYVTCFRRDPTAFEVLRRQVIQALVENHRGDGAIRIWVPGCATGEEAITLAILIEETMAELSKVVPYKIFATDVSHAAIQKAAQTTYLPEQMHGLTPEEVEKYFLPAESGFRLKKLIRDRMLFAPLDLNTDPPLTRMDIVSCRNVLLYFNREMRKRVLKLLHFALSEGGHLFLGASESLDAADGGAFEVVHQGARVYRRVADDGKLSAALSGTTRARAHVPGAGHAAEPLRDAKNASMMRLVETIVGEYQASALLIDRAFHLHHVFGEAGKYLSLNRGAFSMDVTKLVHESLRVPFVAALQRCVRDRADTVCLGGPVTPVTDTSLSIKFKYIGDRDRDVDEFILILFVERSTKAASLALAGGAAGADAEAEGGSAGAGDRELVVRYHELEDELARTKVSLQVSVEDLETANEELQSTNEELMASNEELQSTNEELQSVNEELHTVNSEYQEKITELTEVTGDLENYLESTEAGTIFLDRQLRIRSFTPAVRVAIPLMRHDIGRPIGDLQHSLSAVSLVELSEEVLSNKTSLSRETTNARGNWIQVRLTPYWNRNREVDGVVVTLIDVTDVKEAEFRVRALLEANPDVMFRVSGAGELLDVKLDATQREDLRLPSEDLRLQSIHDLPFPVSARSRLEAAVRTVLEANHGRGEKVSFEFRLGSDYDPRHLQATVTRSGASEAVILIRNVTESKLLTDELARQALYDPLTGILNRRGLEQLLLISLERCRRDGSRLCAILLDIDNFKQINDKLGHSVGDAVLKGVAHKLRACLRPTDLPARIGGDEFLVILSDSRESDAHQLAERLRIAVTEVPLILSMQTERPTASFGLAMVDPETSSLEQVITATQRFLSLSKRHGKNRVIGLGNSTEVTPREDILSTLTSGIHSLVQPIRRLDNRHIVAYEVLSRGPEGQYSSPVVLFRISLEQNALTTVDLHCLKRGLHRVAAELPEKSIFVNVFPSTLLDTPVRKVEELFRDLDDPSRFCVELSEQQFVGDPRCLLDHVAALRGLGVRLAIDDVGFGRSSLESILLLQPDIMKLDRSLVHGISVRRGSRELLGRAMRIADSLNLEVVAEGIEDAADLDILLSLGIPYGQGYLLGGPGRPEDMPSSAAASSGASSPVA